jgi:hypothetical protein
MGRGEGTGGSSVQDREDGGAFAGRVLLARNKVYPDSQGVHQYLLPQGRLEEGIS